MANKIAVVFGGVSNENEISVITGTMACNVLSGGGKEVLPVYITQQGEFFAGKELAKLNTYSKNDLKKQFKALIAGGGVFLKTDKKLKKFIKVDCVLNCCHGGWGEGGGLSGVCAAAGLPMAGAGMFESAAFIDKYLTKQLLKGLEIKTAPYVYVRAGEDLPKDPPEFPLIVKPVTLGSSIGISKVENSEELGEALRCAFIYDSGAIVEKFLPDRREINCAAYMADDKIVVSECEEALTKGDILSFEDKYQGGGRSVMPAEIPAETAAEIQKITGDVYEKLNMRGIVRFDFILSDGIYLSEINTVPGSLAYYLFAKSFKAFYAVLDSVITQAERDFVRSRKKLIKTGILQNIPANPIKTRK